MKFYIASERYTFWQFLYKFTRSGEPNAVLLIYFFVLITTLNSCSPVYYAPGPQQLPAFSKALETKVNLGYAATPSTAGLEASVLHTPTQNLTLAAGHAAYSGQRVIGQTSIYGTGSLSELGLGYYLWLNDQRSLVFDHCFYWAYGNFLYRSSHPFDSNENYHLGSKFQRFSQLTGLSYRSKYFEAGLSVKLAYLQYYEPTQSRFSPTAYVNMVVQHNRLFVVEPCLTLKAGPPFLKFYLSVEASKNLSLAAFPQEKEKLSFGLLARF